MIPLMSISRNFWSGADEGMGLFRQFDVHKADQITRVELNMGIAIRDQPAAHYPAANGTCRATARAVYFGAKSVDFWIRAGRPFGVKGGGRRPPPIHRSPRREQARRDFITHNVHHAWAIGYRSRQLSHDPRAHSAGSETDPK